MHNLFSIREAKIVKGERRDKRKPHFRLGYDEPPPIFAYCAKIMKGEHRTKFILVLLNSRLSYFIGKVGHSKKAYINHNAEMPLYSTVPNTEKRLVLFFPHLRVSLSQPLPYTRKIEHQGIISKN
jgi:hypothetical protein